MASLACKIMVSFKPAVEILQVLATHMGAHRIIACVSKDWAQAAEASKNDLIQKFLNGPFDARSLRVSHLNVCSMNTDMFEQRLSRVVCLNVGEDHHLNEVQLWWYRTQLHLSLSIGRGSICRETSFKDILRACFEYSEFKGYGFSMLERQYREWSGHFPRDLLNRSVSKEVFTRCRYIRTRDLGCVMLGRSINEVLLTLICAMERTEFCRSFCGCAQEEDSSDVEPVVDAMPGTLA